MDFGDYVKYLRKKFRLSIAISLLKSKPENRTIDNYIDYLRSKINDETSNQDEAMSLCSDDFNMELESPNLLEEYNDLFNEDFDVENCEETPFFETQPLPSSLQSAKQSQDIDLNNIHLSNTANINSTKILDNDKQTLFQSINNNLDKEKSKKTTLEDSLVNNKSKNDTKNINLSNQINPTDEHMDTIDLIDKNNDANLNSNTELNNAIVIHNDVLYDQFDIIFDNNLTANKMNDIFYHTQENTHISQSQIECLKIPEKLLRKRNLDSLTKENDSIKIVKLDDNSNKTEDSNNNLNSSSNEVTKQCSDEFNNITNKLDTEITSLNKQKSLIDISLHESQENTFDHHLDLEDKLMTNNINENTQTEAKIRTNHDSLIDTDVRNPKDAINDQNDKNITSIYKLKSSTDSASKVNETYILPNHQNIEENFISNNVTENSQISTFDIHSRQDSLFDTNLRSCLDNLNSQKDIQIKDTLTQIDKVIDELRLQKKATESKEINTQTEDRNDISDTQETDINKTVEESSSDELNDMVESFTESVPSKIMMELNKIKSFLNRNERVCGSADSGFMSDSQRMSGVFGSQSTQTQTSINESAHCVLKFLMESPLNEYTQDIVSDLSKTLGSLIDRLHSTESYPTFLETILLNVEQLIDYICMDSSKGIVPAHQIENDIQKLLLLNKSVHIIIISLQNLTTKLELIYENLIKNDEPYEIKELTIIENLSYTFHLVEILIKRFLTSNTSQTELTGNTQEKKTQKSQLTDFWKRKWDPSFDKNCIKINTISEKDVNLKLSKVLNKFIVNCMEKYVLIAFAALQCFNVLQS